MTYLLKTENNWSLILPFSLTAKIWRLCYLRLHLFSRIEYYNKYIEWVCRGMFRSVKLFYIFPSYLSLTPDWRGIFWKEYLNNFSTYVTRYIPFNLCSCKRKALWVFICIYKYLKSPIWSRRMKIIMVKSGPKWQKMEHKV